MKRNFKLIQALRSRTAEKKWRHPFSIYWPMGIFSAVQGQLTPQSVVQSGRNTNSSALSCMSSYLQVWKWTDEKQPRKSGDTVFSIITISITMETSAWIWPNFQLIQALMYVIITCKYEKDLIKKSRKKWRHRFPIFLSLWVFSDAQEQLTPQSVVQSGRNSNSSELSCMSSLPASMKRIGWKSAEKEWRHRFLHYNPIGAFCCHENQSSFPISPKT